MRRLLLTAVAVAIFAVVPRSAQAGAISGVLDINGAVTVTPTTITWVNCCDITAGTTMTDGAILIAPCTNCDTQLNLNLLAEPAGTPIFLNQFETLSQIPTIDFQLTFIDTCAQDLAGGLAGTCSAGVTSPFVFNETTLNGVTSTTVTLILSGNVFDTAGGPVSTWQGIYTNQFAGQSITDLQTLLATQGFITTSFSASKVAVFAPTVPEPASLLLFATGAAMLGRRLKKRKGQLQTV